MALNYNAIIDAKKWQAEQKMKQPTVGSALGEVARSAVSTYISGKEQENKSGIEAAANERKSMATFANDLFKNYMPVKEVNPESTDPTERYQPVESAQWPQILNFMRQNGGKAPEGVTFIPTSSFKGKSSSKTTIITPQTDEEAAKYNAMNLGKNFAKGVQTEVDVSTLNAGLRGDVAGKNIGLRGKEARETETLRQEGRMTLAEFNAQNRLDLKSLVESDKEINDLYKAVNAARVEAATAKGVKDADAHKLATANLLTASAALRDALNKKHGTDMTAAQLVEVTTGTKWNLRAKKEKIAMTPAHAAFYKEATADLKADPKDEEALRAMAKLKELYPEIVR